MNRTRNSDRDNPLHAAFGVARKQQRKREDKMHEDEDGAKVLPAVIAAASGTSESPKACCRTR